MGLINAIKGSINNVVGDQFKEFVTCPSSDKNVLVQRGLVQHGDANTNPDSAIKDRKDEIRTQCDRKKVAGVLGRKRNL